MQREGEGDGEGERCFFDVMQLATVPGCSSDAYLLDLVRSFVLIFHSHFITFSFFFFLLSEEDMTPPIQETIVYGRITSAGNPTNGRKVLAPHRKEKNRREWPSAIATRIDANGIAG